MTGTIMHIQKYAVHDGPGIRTTVFFKGCPLTCWWCHNPESQRCQEDILFFQERCTQCGLCEKQCPQSAITLDEPHVFIDHAACSLCGICTDVCPHNALEYVGRSITVSELMKEIEKDTLFYEESGGGVTFSGGEPMVQAEFLNQVLTACKEKGIHTAVDVSGYGSWKDFQTMMEKVDVFLFDLKLMDDEKHKKYVGISNKEMLECLTKLSQAGAHLHIRMPIIKGINDHDEHIRDSIDFLSKQQIKKVHLLPYHKLGMDKYRRLNRTYLLTGKEKPSEQRMKEIAQSFQEAGIPVKIGG